MNDPTTKAQLLHLIRTERARLEERLAPLTEAQMTQPGLAGDWSVKDILLHIVDWEQYLVRRLQAGLRGERPEVRVLDTEAEIDRFNEQCVAANQERPLADAQAEFRRSFEEVLQVVEALSEEDLFDESRREPLTGRADRPVWHSIAGETYEHYREHDEQIRAWLEESA